MSTLNNSHHYFLSGVKNINATSVEIVRQNLNLTVDLCLSFFYCIERSRRHEDI